MVPSDWDLAPKCVCGSNFISYLIGISFDGRAGSLTGNSPIVSCEKKCLGASDEGIYE